MTSRIDRCATIVEHHQAGLIDGFWVDVQTASLLQRIWAALSPANREKFERLPLRRLVDFAWAHVEKKEASC